MGDKLPVVLSETDLEVLALMEQADQQFQIYWEIIRKQAPLRPRKQPVSKLHYSWDHPLHLVIGKDEYALVERLAAGDRRSGG